MLIACPQCGAANDEHAQACYVCDAIYPSAEKAIQREPAVPAAKSAPAAAEKPAPRKRASRARKVKATAVPPSVAVEEIAPIVEAVKAVVAQEAAPEPVAAAPPVQSPEENEKLIQAMAEALDKELRPVAKVAEPQPEATAEEPAAEPEAAPVPAPQAESVEEILTAAAEDLRAAQETLEEAVPEILEPAIVESHSELETESEEPAEVIGFAPAQPPASEAAREESAEEIPEEMPVAVAAGGREESAPVLTLRSSSRESTARSASAEPARNVTSFPVQEPEWRREVQRRLQNYRAKRRRVQDGEAQPQLPFAAEPAVGTPEEPAYRESLRIRSNSRAAEAPKPRVVEITASTEELSAAAPAAEPAPQETHALESHAEISETVEAPPAEPTSRIEVPVMQPEFHFTVPDEADHPHAPLVPVADVRERSRAVGIDLACVAAGYGFFLGIFAMLGGHFSFGKPEAGIFAVTFFLLYAAYFVLFTAFGGATPGMYFRGLSVVNFDGAPAGPRQLLWRSFGYLVSGVTILGFLWAWWDEDHLTWHDRISQTYLTTAESSMWADFAATAFPEHSVPGYDDEDDSAT